jgi:hypothetical protein
LKIGDRRDELFLSQFAEIRGREETYLLFLFRLDKELGSFVSPRTSLQSRSRSFCRPSGTALPFCRARTQDLRPRLHSSAAPRPGADSLLYVLRRLRPDEPGPLDGPMGPSLRELCSLWTKQVPGFVVVVVHAGLGVVAAAEQEAGVSQEGLERDYVPGVFGDHVSAEEMNLAGLVRDGAASDAALGVQAKHAVDYLGGAFDLDSPEGRIGVGILARTASCRSEGAGVEDYIVTFAVTEGLGDSEAEGRGFQGEG